MHSAYIVCVMYVVLCVSKDIINYATMQMCRPLSVLDWPLYMRVKEIQQDERYNYTADVRNAL